MRSSTRIAAFCKSLALLGTLLPFAWRAPQLQAQASGPHLRGHVYDESGKPIGSARVTASDKARAAAATDQNGYFVLELRPDVKLGDLIWVHVEKGGYKPGDIQVGVSAESDTPFRLVRMQSAQPSQAIPPPPVGEVARERVRKIVTDQVTKNEDSILSLAHPASRFISKELIADESVENDERRYAFRFQYANAMIGGHYALEVAIEADSAGRITSCRWGSDTGYPPPGRRTGHEEGCSTVFTKLR